MYPCIPRDTTNVVMYLVIYYFDVSWIEAGGPDIARGKKFKNLKKIFKIEKKKF